jgi:glycine/D-amino acid oxidase-like deaminating enzyme
MAEPDEKIANAPEARSVAIVGAGIIGCSAAFALSRAGHRVLLFDRAPPGEAGASYGNAGHVATELLEPLPAPGLLFGFWRELFAFGGVLDIPVQRLPAFAPWAMRFARAAFQRRANTALLAPFVRPAVPALIGLLGEAGRPDLIRQNGHYQIWLKGRVERLARAQAQAMERLEVATRPAPGEVVEAARHAARAQDAAGLWFPGCAHVVDPLEVVRAFATAAAQLGARIHRRDVLAIRPAPEGCEVVTAEGNTRVQAAVVCAGAWSAPLLTPFGFRVPLEAARGYHVQMPDAAPLVDAPIVYSDQNIVVTPMAGRVRATSFMEFAGVDAPSDPGKSAWLRNNLRALGYACDDAARSWVGPRPVLPDYLPAIGRCQALPCLHYAFAHQHIGLTLSAVTARAVADLVAGRPRPDLDGFDLRRFR